MTHSNPGQPSSTGHLTEFNAGARDIIPMMVGAAPFGVIFGTLVASGPLHLWHGQLMSLVVFAGSAQFIALGLIPGHASLAVIWATTLVVNLRHVLYSATLAPLRFASALRWRLALGGCSPTKSSPSHGHTTGIVRPARSAPITSLARAWPCT